MAPQAASPDAKFAAEKSIGQHGKWLIFVRVSTRVDSNPDLLSQSQSGLPLTDPRSFGSNQSRTSNSFQFAAQSVDFPTSVLSFLRETDD